jgi:hypothetical protein
MRRWWRLRRQGVFGNLRGLKDSSDCRSICNISKDIIIRESGSAPAFPVFNAKNIILLHNLTSQLQRATARNKAGLSLPLARQTRYMNSMWDLLVFI